MRSINHCSNSAELQSGGISLWSQNDLLSEKTLSLIVNEIQPQTQSCLMPIVDWDKHADHQLHYHCLINMIDAKFPNTPFFSQTQRLECAKEILLESIKAFSQPQRSTSNGSVQDYLKNTIKQLVPAEDEQMNALQKSLFAQCAWLLFLQNIGDNPRYTPHGYAHSTEVAMWMAKIIDLVPEKLAPICKRHWLNNQQAQALMQITGLLHDCGYPYLTSTQHQRKAGAQRATKATHAVIGGFMFHKIIQPTLVKLLLTQNVRHPQTLCRQMCRAIHLHSSDKPEAQIDNCLQVSTLGGALLQVNSPEQLSWLKTQMPRLGDDIVRIKTDLRQTPQAHALRATLHNAIEVKTSKKTLAPARQIDALNPADKAIGTPCCPIDMNSYPIAYWLMLADNLDITDSRLGPVQSHQAYGQLLLALHQNKYPIDTALPATASKFYYQPLNHRFPSPPLNQILLHAIASAPTDIPFLIGALSIAQVKLEKNTHNRLKPLKATVYLKALPQWLVQEQQHIPDLFKHARLNLDRLIDALTHLKPSVDVAIIDCNNPQHHIASYANTPEDTLHYQGDRDDKKCA